MKVGTRKQSIAIVLSLACLILNVVPGHPAYARKSWADSPLSDDQQITLEKAGHLVKSGHADKATPIILTALESANDIPKCLAIAAFTEGYGAPLNDVRRDCLKKALSLSTTREDLLQVSLKSRQYECYEVTRDCINKLLGSAGSREDYLDLARKAQELAANDVMHMALEKALQMTNTVPDAITFMKEAKLLGAEDLMRKTAKDLIDDETNAHQLMMLLKQFEPFQLTDLNRYLMKKALDQATAVDDYVEIYHAARRHREQDIQDLALFRGKKKKIIQQIQQDRAGYQQQLDAYRQGQQDAQAAKAQQDVSNGAANPEKNGAGF